MALPVSLFNEYNVNKADISIFCLIHKKLFPLNLNLKKQTENYIFAGGLVGFGILFRE